MYAIIITRRFKMAGRTNYLNNRDILKEIRKSKLTYCAFRDKTKDTEYDIILNSLSELTPESIAQAKQNRVDALKREKVIVDPDTISVQDLVFRVTTWEHIPIAPPKPNKTKKQDLTELFEIDDDEPLNNIEDEVVLDDVHIRLNFPPFFHYRLDENNQPVVVGKSHWKGSLEDGEFCKDHGSMTDTLARMLIKLCDRYASRSNWRNYTYNEEMRGEALVHLSHVALKFNEAKSQNPFSYLTQITQNSFTRVLNIEKKMQNIRDDILEMNGLNPSWSRQNSESFNKYEE